MFPEIKAAIARHKAITGEDQEAIALKMGMASSTFSHKLTGKTEFKLSELIMLSEILGGLSIDFLVGHSK